MLNRTNAILTIGLAWAAAIGPATVASAAQPTVSPQLTLQAAGMRDQDDLTFWLHPTELARSTIITSDKAAHRLVVYDLEGKPLQTVAARQPGNIDTRYGFRLGGQSVDIVAFNERATNRVRVYKVDPGSRQLAPIDDGRIDSGSNYGFALYRSPGTGRFYAFTSPHSGAPIKQFELVDNGRGRVSGIGPLRELRVGSLVEGMVADDEQGKLYVAQESGGIWAFDAEPDRPAVGTKVASTGEHGLVRDVEGLTIYHMAGGQGYLIASSQGNSTFKVYERKPPHAFVGSFSVSGVAQTDGVDVVSLPLNGVFSQGVFASHNGRAGPYPVQLAKWQDVAAALGLKTDTAYGDPRRALPVGTTAVAAVPEKVPAPHANATGTPPPASGATAALVAAGKVKEDKGTFRVQAACRSGDAKPAITLNDIPVDNGQAVKLELDDDEHQFKRKRDQWKFKAPEFRLLVSCKDAAGNVQTATAMPAFADDD